MNILGTLESLVAEVPENIGKALTVIGTELEELAAKLEAHVAQEHSGGQDHA